MELNRNKELWFLVEQEDVENHFDELRPIIDSAIEEIKGKGFAVRYNSDYLKLAALDKDILMSYITNNGIISMVAALEVINYADARVLHIRFIAGENFDEAYSEWMDLLKDFANFMQADAIEASCIPSMARLLQSDKFGFKVQHVRVRFDLQNTVH